MKAKRLRLGQVGGGQGAFIGAVHRIAARIDDHYELVAGAFASTSEKSKASGAELGIEPERTYGTFDDMARAEAMRADGIDAVSIVTPNHVHFAAAKAFLDAGIHVICDKPMTTTLKDAKTLKALVESSKKIFVLTHNYTGYPMVRQARAMVEAGELGEIRVIQVEYPQDWLTTNLEETGLKQAVWRTDPAQSGPAGATGDIGTHAYNLACYITGLKAESLLADLSIFNRGRRLDDNAQILVRYEQGAKGMIWASQVAPGNQNALKIRVYGARGGLTWHQENPNDLHHAPFGEPPRLISRSGPGAGDAAARVSRIPGGHPEGYLEGFATIYTDAAELIRARDAGRAPDAAATSLPNVQDGIEGVAFIAAVVESSARGGVWLPLDRS